MDEFDSTSGPAERLEGAGGRELDPRELARLFGSTRRLASVLVGAESLGEDAEQDVILAALERPRRVHRGAAAWFHGALRKRLLHLRRGQATRRERELRVMRERELQRPAEPHAAVQRAELQERLVATVMRLPEPYRTVIVLHYLEERDTRELAAELGRPLSSVHTQLHRGLALLRVRLSADDRAGGERWSEALAALLVPHAAALRGKVARLERELRGVRPARVARHARTVAALALATVASAVLVFERAQRAGQASGASLERRESSATLEVASESAAAHAARVDLPSATPDSVSAVAAPSAPEEASLAAAPRLRLALTRAEDGRALASASAFFDRAPAPGITSPVRAEDRAGAVRAASDGTLTLALSAGLPAWLRIEAPERAPALVHVESVERGLTVALVAACELRVVGESGVSLLAAKVWPVASAPIALPPLELSPEEPSAYGREDTGSAARERDLVAWLAPGRYIVSAMGVDAGERRIDSAVVELSSTGGTRWTAFDRSEAELTLRVEGATRSQVWTATLCEEASGQLLAEGCASGEQPLRLRSLPAGRYSLRLSSQSVRLSPRPLEIPPGEARVERSLRLPRAALSVELEPSASAGSEPLLLLTGPLERAGDARPTQVAFGREARFEALESGSYELWTRSPCGFGRTRLRLEQGDSHLAPALEAGAGARLTYSGEPPMRRHEVVLRSSSGTSLPLTFGLEAGAASVFGRAALKGERESADGSLTFALPAGDYELFSTVDGEFRVAQQLRLVDGQSLEVGPGRAPAATRLVVTQAGRPLCQQLVELSGHLADAGPLAFAPGPLWMLSGVTDASGQLELPLASAHWTAAIAGGGVACFESRPERLELRVDFGLAPR